MEKIQSSSVRWRAVVMCASLFALAAFFAVQTHAGDPEVRDMGSRLELFVDEYLIDKMDNTRLKLHHPRKEKEVFPMEKPWEGVYCGYTTVFKDGDLYRMYYLGYPVDPPGNFTCYAESKDGIHWRRPELGLVEFQGSKKNNIIMTGGPESHNFSPFLDTKPGVPSSEKYKAVGGIGGVFEGAGLMAYASPDGIHWKKMREQGVITKGAFDSHNLAFYSETEQCYVCYFRTFRHGVRWITRTTSDDFLNWTEPVDMDFGETPPEQLYTNSTTPYFRAPHIYIALPCRCIFGKDVASQEMKKKLGVAEGYQPKGTGYTDMPLMTSRGGNTYQRTFMETFILPGIGLKNWTSRANYPAFGIVPTPDSDTRMSIYVNRHTGYPSAHIARYTLRYDGFISVFAPYSGGELLTKPLKFGAADGSEKVELVINYATSTPGAVRCEILDEIGKPIEGFSLAECDEIVGDEIERVVSWKGRTDLKDVAGKPVRLRFAMKAADLYSIRFR